MSNLNLLTTLGTPESARQMQSATELMAALYPLAGTVFGTIGCLGWRATNLWTKLSVGVLPTVLLSFKMGYDVGHFNGEPNFENILGNVAGGALALYGMYTGLRRQPGSEDSSE